MRHTENKLDISGIPKTSDCDPISCPTCGEDHFDQSGSRYSINGIEYPKIGNDRTEYYPEPNYKWDEIHYCTKCKKEYRYVNGT